MKTNTITEISVSMFYLFDITLNLKKYRTLIQVGSEWSEIAIAFDALL